MKNLNKVILLSLTFTWIIFFPAQVANAQTIIAPREQMSNCLYKGEKPLVPIKKICAGNVIHRFHDTSPLSPSGRFMALFRMPFDDHYPAPGDTGEVILVNMKTLKEQVISKSFGWEMQVGANVQWGASDHELFFNNVDTTNWEMFTIKYDPLSGTSKRINGTLFMVSLDGKKLVSHNLANSVHAQSGYGAIIPDSLTNHNIGPVDTDGIYVTDVESGNSKMIVSIRDIYEKTTPQIKVSNPQDFEFYCFKAMWNQQATRIMTCLMLKPLDGGKRKVALITMRPNGSEIRTAITFEQYAKGGHHMAWLSDGEHISMNLENDGKPGLEIITVKYNGSELKNVFPTGSGHPSFHPKGLPFIITDSYRNEPVTNHDGFVPLRLLNTQTCKEIVVARVFVPDVKDASFRVDLHPAWDRSGRYVIFNGYDDNGRCVFMADMKDLIYKK